MEDINIRFVNFVILALLKKSFRYLCHCDTFCLFKYYSDWWSNCEFICNNSITIWECQKCNHFRDNEYETTGINVGPRFNMTWVMFILHKCDKMGFSSVKRMIKTKVSANVRYEIQRGNNNEKMSILMRQNIYWSSLPASSYFLY